MKSNKEIKKDIVSEIETEISSSNSIIIWKYHGLNANQFSNFRINVKQNQDLNKIYKNRLAKIAFKNQGKDEIVEKLVGPNAFLFIKNDESETIKILDKIVKDIENIEFVGGYLDGTWYDGNDLAIIASLPSKTGMISMLLSVLQAPIRNLAYSISQINMGEEE